MMAQGVNVATFHLGSKGLHQIPKECGNPRGVNCALEYSLCLRRPSWPLPLGWLRVGGFILIDVFLEALCKDEARHESRVTETSDDYWIKFRAF